MPKIGYLNVPLVLWDTTLPESRMPGPERNFEHYYPPGAYNQISGQSGIEAGWHSQLRGYPGQNVFWPIAEQSRGGMLFPYSAYIQRFDGTQGNQVSPINWDNQFGVRDDSVIYMPGPPDLTAGVNTG